MKITVSNNNENKQAEYPCLMEHKRTGSVVLFHSNERGTRLSSEKEGQQIGFQHDMWDMGDFRSFKGSITLEND